MNLRRDWEISVRAFLRGMGVDPDLIQSEELDRYYDTYHTPGVAAVQAAMRFANTLPTLGCCPHCGSSFVVWRSEATRYVVGGVSGGQEWMVTKPDRLVVPQIISVECGCMRWDSAITNSNGNIVALVPMGRGT